MSSEPNRPSRCEILLFAIAAAALGFFAAPERIVLSHSDPTAYYAYLRSSLIDGDLHFKNDYEWSRRRQLHQTATGLYHNPQPVGPALLWAPFFLAAHAVTGLANTLTGQAIYTRDGREEIYLYTVGFGSLLFVWAGLLACYLGARRLFSKQSVQWSVLVMAFTPLVIICLYGMPILSHPASFLLASLIFLLLPETRQKLGGDRLLFLGVLIGLASAVRYQNAALLLFPLGALGASLGRGDRGSRWRTVLLPAAGLLIGFLAGVCPQLVIWKVFHDRWLVSPYETRFLGTYFRFVEPKFALALFSHPRFFNSLIPWVPAALLGLCGFRWLWKQDRWLATLGLLFFLIQLYTTAITRQMARLEGPANHLLIRRFDSCIPLFILGLAAVGQRAFAWLKRDDLWPWRPLIVVLTVILCLDGWMMSHAPALWHLNGADSVNSWALHGRNFDLLLREPDRALSLHLILGQLHRSWPILLVLVAFAAVALRWAGRGKSGAAATPNAEGRPQEARRNTPRWLVWIAAHRYWLFSVGLMLYLLLWAAYLWSIGPVRPALG